MDTDVALANRLARDVDAAFPALVAEHQDRLYTIALRLLGDRRDAEEVAQDALVRAFRAMHGYPRERIAALRLRPWLASIAVNLARNRRRRARRPAAAELARADARRRVRPAVGDARSAPGVGRRPARDAARAGRRAAPARRRRCASAIVLRHVDGLSVAETAEALGRPEGTIKAQVHRGLRELRVMLEAPARNRPVHQPAPAAPPHACCPPWRPSDDHRDPSPTPRSRPRCATSGSPLRRRVGFGALVEAGLADRYAPIETPLGRGVRGLERPRRVVGRPGRGRRRRSSPLPGRRRAARSRRPRRCRSGSARAIARRLAGDRRVRIPLDLRGHTPFEVAVWMKALEIPRGEVRPYGWIAAEIGKPKAVRAVGTALAHNPVPLVVPCHRVVRSDGMIGQYSMGGPRREAPRSSPPRAWTPRWLEAEAAAGHPLHRLGHDAHRLPPDLSRRAPGDATAIGSRSRASRRRPAPATGRACTAGRSRSPPSRAGSGDQLLLGRGAEPGHDSVASEPAARLARPPPRSPAAPPARRPRGVASRPRRWGAAPTRRRPGRRARSSGPALPLRSKSARACVAEIEASVGPAHRRRVERGQERDPRRRARASARGRREARSLSSCLASRRRSRPRPPRRRPAPPSCAPPSSRSTTRRRARVPGPKAASQRRTSSTRARSGGQGSSPPSTQRSIGAQRYRLLSHVPLGRPRMIRPSVASRKSRRVETPTVPCHFFPSPKVICSRKPATRFVRSAAVASPRSRRASTVSASTFASHRAGSFVMPAPSSMPSSRLRSRSPRAVVTAAWITPASATGATNIVRRMPRILSRERSSYRAVPTCSRVRSRNRALRPR